MDIPIEKLKNGQNPAVCLAAARLVANLCYTEANKQKVCDQGALPSLLEYTKQGQVQIAKGVNRDALTMGKKLGRGTFAVVYKGMYLLS